MREIEQITDFAAVEDAIEAFVSAGSGIERVYWAGYEFERIRPCAVIKNVSQLTTGHPWTRFSRVTENLVQKRKNVYYQPFEWKTQVTFFTDAYEASGNKRTAIRKTAYRYAQDLLNRAFLEPVVELLGDIAHNPVSQNIIPNVLPQVDDDKYIHQAAVEFVFAGVAATAVKDSDRFETITVPTEENERLNLGA